MITVKVRENRFDQIAAELVARAPVLVDETVAALRARVEATSPVGETGNLSHEITVIPAHPVTLGLRGGIELEPYWHFVEYGTHRQAAHPFVTPAMELLRAPFIAGARKLLSI